MDPNQIKHGFLYAVTSHDDSLDSLEPYVAIETDVGIRFAHAGMWMINTSIDGPHQIPVEIAIWARHSGWVLDPDDIWGFWSERELLEELIAEADGIDHPVVQEAEKILRESGTPDGRASTWLRHSSDWPGSSMSAAYDEDGRICGAYVSVFTANPYKLRALMRWLGVPQDMVQDVTKIDKLGRQMRPKRGDQTD